MKKIRTRVAVVAPSAKLPPLEFGLGIEFLRSEGFEVFVHEQCSKQASFFAGTDAERASAFSEVSANPDFDVIWCARGGYGAFRVLEELVLRPSGPPKLLVGYSDATVLMEYVRRQWGWHTLHAAMPSLRRFSLLKPSEWRATRALVRGEVSADPLGLGGKKLKWLGGAPQAPLVGEWVGGNLTVLTTLLGTRHAPSFAGKVLFLEDVDEAWFRVDRMVRHLGAAGALKDCLGIVLGDFLNCEDRVPPVLRRDALKKARARSLPQIRKALSAPKPTWMEPLRKPMPSMKAMTEIFGGLGLPVAYGLPSGHGPGFTPLPLGGQFKVGTDGRVELLRWGGQI